MFIDKMLSNLCSDLRIRHFVNCFDSYNLSIDVIFDQPFFEFTFCFTWLKDENRFSIPNADNYCVVINIQVFRKISLTALALAKPLPQQKPLACENRQQVPELLHNHPQVVYRHHAEAVSPHPILSPQSFPLAR
jgi:hypothetical protein